MARLFFQFSQADGFVDGVGGVQAVREDRPVADPVFKEAAVVGPSGDNGRTGLSSLLFVDGKEGLDEGVVASNEVGLFKVLVGLEGRLAESAELVVQLLAHFFRAGPPAVADVALDTGFGLAPLVAEDGPGS